MRTKTVELYTYGELSPEAQEKARDWYRDASAGDDFWSECAIEGIAEAGGFLGITFDTPRGRQSGKAIWFSGFASQGDGCSYDGTWRASDCNADKVITEFTGDGASNVELRRIAAGLAAIAKDYPEACAQVASSHRYHSLSIDSDCGSELPNNAGLNYESDEYDAALTAWRDDFPADELADLLRDFASWAYQLLESEYDYQNSDEAVAETLIANEYEFTAKGGRF
jgi:hypothetical protein